MLFQKIVDRIGVFFKSEIFKKIVRWIGFAFYLAIIVSEFYLKDWKSIVKDRLESLSSIDETMRGNLTFSWERFLDLVSVAGWAILLIGYFCYI